MALSHQFFTNFIDKKTNATLVSVSYPKNRDVTIKNKGRGYCLACYERFKYMYVNILFFGCFFRNNQR